MDRIGLLVLRKNLQIGNYSQMDRLEWILDFGSSCLLYKKSGKTDFGFWILDSGSAKEWILDFGSAKVMDFGFRILGKTDFGSVNLLTDVEIQQKNI